jgi:glycosyltransferase involved in cell wall biosynthesis
MAKLFGIKFVSEINFTSRTPLVRKRTRFIEPFDRLFEKILLRHADGMVAVSNYLKRQLMEMGVEADKIIMLPNAADPSKFDPERDASILKRRLCLDGKLVVGFVGHFYPWHGVDFLLDSFPIVDSKIKNFVYILIGSGPTFNEVRRRIISQGLQDRILLVGQVDHSKIPDYVAIFDIAVMPNSNNYGSPMKVLEYMAMAKATVIPRLGPLEDIVQDGVDGMLFDPNAAHQMAEKIILFLSDKKLRNDIGHNARVKIESKHNWNANASQILDLCQRIKRI